VILTVLSQLSFHESGCHFSPSSVILLVQHLFPFLTLEKHSIELYELYQRLCMVEFGECIYNGLRRRAERRVYEFGDGT
jgi:hypothetical protein